MDVTDEMSKIEDVEMGSLRWEDTMRKCSADEKAQMGLGVTPQVWQIMI